MPALVGRKFAIKELERASRGEIVVAVSDPTRTMDGLGASSHKAMVEIHVPIRDANGRVIAVGEVHKDMSALQERQSQVVSGMWLIRSLSLALGTATLFILVSRAHK